MEKLSTEDKKDILKGSVNNVITEFGQLGVISEELRALMNSEEPDVEDIINVLVKLVAQNANVTGALTTAMLTHLQATDLLAKNTRLHS